MPPKKAYKKSSRRPYKRAYKKRTSVSTNIKKYVKNQIHKNIENKSVSIEKATEFGSYLQNNTMNVQPMCPYTTLFPGPSSGVLVSNKIGNEIRPRQVMLRYVLRPTPYSATTNPNPVPVYVQMFLGYLKQASGVLLQVLDFTIFNAGSTSFTPSGTLSDLCAPLNKDQWTIVKTWTHKIGYSDAQNTGLTSTWQGYANNDFKISVVKKLNITKHIPKVIKFNDAAQSQQGRNLFFFYQALAANGSPMTADIRPVAINYWIDFHYEDA